MRGLGNCSIPRSSAGDFFVHRAKSHFNARMWAIALSRAVAREIFIAHRAKSHFNAVLMRDWGQLIYPAQ